MRIGEWGFAFVLPLRDQQAPNEGATAMNL